MSQRIRPISRRSVLKLSGVAPLVMLANCAWANSTEEAMADVRAASRPYDPPPDQLAKVLSWAQAAGANRARFELVTHVLWYHFMTGVDSHGVGLVEVPPSEKILELGYSHNSGAALRRNLDKFDGGGVDAKTNYCAFVCGHNAYVAAIQTRDKVVTKAIYRKAWTDTKTDFNDRLAAARRIGKRMGIGNRGNPGTGYACG